MAEEENKETIFPASDWWDHLEQRFSGLMVDRKARRLTASDPEMAFGVARFLKDDATSHCLFCSNVTGVDFLPAEEKVKGKNEEGKTVITKVEVPGRIEVVYHLQSLSRPKIWWTLVQKCPDRHQPQAASLTPLWASADFQEREVFDLYGVVFKGHPDLRRLLMWEEFKDHPMLKDYCEPEDEREYDAS